MAADPIPSSAPLFLFRLFKLKNLQAAYSSFLFVISFEHLHHRLKAEPSFPQPCWIAI
jgi:hypothetical protein